MAKIVGKQSNPPLTIVFFGLGAVGSSMLICLAELAERDGIPVRFKEFSIDPASARDALYHAERLMKRIEIVGVPSFDPLLAPEGPWVDELAGAALLVNAAIPQFNCPVIELGIRLGAHTLDLASDMYNSETASSLTFNQYAHDAALRERGVAALVNMGVSPGITNFLIGDQMCRISSEHRKELEIESIDLYLLEDLDADVGRRESGGEDLWLEAWPVSYQPAVAAVAQARRLGGLPANRGTGVEKEGGSDLTPQARQRFQEEEDRLARLEARRSELGGILEDLAGRAFTSRLERIRERMATADAAAAVRTLQSDAAALKAAATAPKVAGRRDTGPRVPPGTVANLDPVITKLEQLAREAGKRDQGDAP